MRAGAWLRSALRRVGIVAGSKVLGAVRRCIGEVCDVDQAKVRPEGKLMGYGLDSVRVVDLLLALEETLGVSVSEHDPELGGVQTVGQLADLVERRLGNAPGAP